MTQSPFSLPYSYPVSNTDIIKLHSLDKHFEGGYFAQTVSLETSDSLKSPTPKSKGLGGNSQTAWGPGTLLTGGKKDGSPGEDVNATMIYYLLTPDSYRCKMHMNLHSVSLSQYRS